jgi:hypothetical protein
MTNAEWEFDIQRRAMENVSHCLREAKLKAKRVVAAKQVKLMERAAAMAAPHTLAHLCVPAAWSGSQGNISSPSPSTASPSPLFHDTQGNPPQLSRFSPSFHDFDPLCGFNPNTFAAQTTFAGPNTFVAPNTFTTGDMHMLAVSP